MARKPTLVALTRSKEGNKAWAAAFRRKRIATYGIPAIETVPVPPSKKILASFKKLDTFDWIIFTSAAGIRYSLDILRMLRKTPRSIKTGVAAIGYETARKARDAGFTISFIPSQSNTDTLGKELPLVPGKRILLLHADIATPMLAQSLRARGSTVIDCALYHTILVKGHDDVFSEHLAKGRIRAVVFASPSAVRGFSKRLQKKDLVIARKLPSIAIGKSTETALRKNTFTRIRVAEKPSTEEIAKILERVK